MADSYTIYAASGLACLSLLRSLFSAAFPLFGHQMFTGISANAASSVLAGIATVFCASAYVFKRYGRVLRERSAFARYSLKASLENGLDNDDEEEEEGCERL